MRLSPRNGKYPLLRTSQERWYTRADETDLQLRGQRSLLGD